MTPAAPLLEMQGVEKRFGATHALRGVSFSVRPGEVMALIGENGAGKSTLMKVLSGAVSPDGGRMWFGGGGYAPTGPADARRAGVAMIYQELNLAPDLSIEDNVMLGQEESCLGVLQQNRQRERVRDALARLGHAELRPHTLVRTLPVGVQQLVEIARALVQQARLIVFDEPTSSLTRQDVERLFAVIRKLREEGLGIVYISHFLEEVRTVCDRYTVLRDGQSVGSGELADVSEAQIVALMVGRSVGELFPRIPHTPGDVLLELDGLTGLRAPRDVRLALRRGEVLGLFGLVGAGRTELVRAVFGLDPVRSGGIRVAGRTPGRSPAARIRAGLGMVSEDRKTEGLAQDRSLADNLTLSRLGPYSRLGWLSLPRRRAAVQDWMERLAIKARSPDQPVHTLSGGNQQKVALARVLHQEADVLLLDEPTRGVDVGAKAEIYRLIGEAAAAGRGVLFVSSYLPELLAVCDRVGVMSRGRLREIRPAPDWNEPEALSRAIAGDEAVELASREHPP